MSQSITKAQNYYQVIERQLEELCDYKEISDATDELLDTLYDFINTDESYYIVPYERVRNICRALIDLSYHEKRGEIMILLANINRFVDCLISPNNRPESNLCQCGKPKKI